VLSEPKYIVYFVFRRFSLFLFRHGGFLVGRMLGFFVGNLALWNRRCCEKRMIGGMHFDLREISPFGWVSGS